MNVLLVLVTLMVFAPTIQDHTYALAKTDMKEMVIPIVLVCFVSSSGNLFPHTLGAKYSTK